MKESFMKIVGGWHEMKKGDFQRNVIHVLNMKMLCNKILKMGKGVYEAFFDLDEPHSG